MRRFRLLIRSIRENPVSIAFTTHPVERISVILSRSAGFVEPFDTAVRQLRTHFALLLKPQRARKKKPFRNSKR